MKKLISMLFMAVLAVLTMTGCDDEETVLQKYTVTFNSQGGSEVAPQAVYAGEKIVKPANPTKEKEYFVDWYKEAECTNVWDFENETVSQDITLYAKWTSIAYTVTFETNEGTPIEAQLVPEGTFATKPVPAPTKEGYLFEGWYTEQTMTNLFDFYTPITKDITLYAKWMDISSITLNDLQQLFGEAERLTYQEYAYTEESLLALRKKIGEIRPIINDPSSATQEEIATAYQTLHAAIQALVELPYRQTASLKINPTPTAEGAIPVYISKDNVNVSIEGLDNNGNPATRPNIKLEFDGNEMAKWGDYSYYDNQLYIYNLKSSLKAGTTIDIKVICNDNPSLSTTITLKAIDAEEQKATFITTMDNLPTEISFDNCLSAFNVIKNIEEQYSNLSRDLKKDADIEATIPKLKLILTKSVEIFPDEFTFDNCLQAFQIINAMYSYCMPSIYTNNLLLIGTGLSEDTDIKAAQQKFYDDIYSRTWAFTIYTAYKFEGNICTATDYRGYEDKYEYTAEGNFPYGTYTREWIYDDYNNIYSQYKIVLKSDYTYQRYWRETNSEAEKETTEWKNGEVGTYKLTGDQANGGSLILKADY